MPCATRPRLSPSHRTGRGQWHEDRRARSVRARSGSTWAPAMLARAPGSGNRVRRQAGPRHEAPHVPPGPPGVAASIRNPAPSTARSVSRLGRQPPLTRVQRGCSRSCHRAHRGCRGPDVLEHPKRPAGPEDAADLGEPAGGIVDAAEDEAAHHGVEDAGAERERLGARLDEPRRGRAPPGPAERLAGRIDPDRAGREGGRFRPVPQPRSSTRPRAPSQRRRRQRPSPVPSMSEHTRS